MIDSQSVRASDWVSRATKGYDAAKKVHGRKRHLAVDTGGLLLEVLVTPASTQDRDGGRRLLWRLRHHFPTLRLVCWHRGRPESATPTPLESII